MKLDKKQLKHYGFVSLVLGGISCISALLIAVSYMITQPIIDDYNREIIKQSLKVFYGEDCTYSLLNEVSDNAYSYLEGYYSATNDNETLGYIFSCSGNNDYGSISMLVSIDALNNSIGKVVLIVNDQSFGSKAQSEYVDKFNNGEISINDVNCGATYSATLIRDMSLQAQDYAISFLTMVGVG